MEGGNSGSSGGAGRRVMPVLGELNDGPILAVEIEGALRDLKEGKAPGMDGIAPELIERGESYGVVFGEAFRFML